MKNANDLKYGVYTRKSSESEDRQVASLGDQKQDLEKIIKRDELNVYYFEPESQSEHKTGRVVFNEMVEAIKDKKINAILCWHLNRLARNATDGAKLIDLMDRGLLKQIKTMSGVFYGFTSDKMMLQIEFAMSKKYSDELSDTVKQRLRSKFEYRKEWICLAKAGYLNKRDEITSQNKIVVDKDRFKLLQKAGHLIIDGTHTANEVWHILNDEWGYRTKQRKRTGGG